MLTNVYPDAALLQYKNIYLKNFSEETNGSFAFLTNEYLLKQNIYLSLDDNNNLQLGLMVIPKQIVINQKSKKAALIYGIVASDAYKHTKILLKLLPPFLKQLMVEYNIILIESHHWKIYQNFDLLPLNQYNEYVYKKSSLRNIKNYLFDVEPTLAAKLFHIFQTEIKNFQFANYVSYDLMTFTKNLKLNQLMHDKIILVNQAYGLYSSTTQTISGLHFATIHDLWSLIAVLPKNTQILIDQRFAKFLPNNLIATKTYYKTKMFNQPFLIKSLFFSEMN